MKLSKLLCALLLAFLGFTFFSGPSHGKTKSTPEEEIKSLFPGRKVEIEKFSTPPYEVLMIDGRFFLFDPKNKIVFPSAFSLEGEDLLEPFKVRYILNSIGSLNLSNLIHYTKKSKKGADRVVLFTDPQCPFCKKTFNLVKKKAERGEIDLYIGFIPVHRNILQVEKILCTKNPSDAYSRIIKGEKLDLKKCEEGKKRFMAMLGEARKLGFGGAWRGVPLLINVDKRELVLGYQEDRIKKLIGKEKLKESK